jgi:hypothetical protein
MFLILAIGAVIALCALLWRVAIFALPVFVGFSAGFWALSFGAGIGAGLVGLVAGAFSWELAKHVFRRGNSTVKTGVAILFALPAAYTGFEIVAQISGDAVASTVWRTVFGITAGLACGGTLLARLSQARLVEHDK